MSCRGCWLLPAGWCICQLPTWMRSGVPSHPGQRQLAGPRTKSLSCSCSAGGNKLPMATRAWLPVSQLRFCWVFYVYFLFSAAQTLPAVHAGVDFENASAVHLALKRLRLFCKEITFKLHREKRGVSKELEHKLGTFAANRFPTDALTIYLALFYAKSFRQPRPCNRIVHLLSPCRRNRIPEKKNIWIENRGEQRAEEGNRKGRISTATACA